jgi:hypothetical protein
MLPSYLDASGLHFGVWHESDEQPLRCCCHVLLHIQPPVYYDAFLLLLLWISYLPIAKGLSLLACNILRF